MGPVGSKTGHKNGAAVNNETTWGTIRSMRDVTPTKPEEEGPPSPKKGAATWNRQAVMKPT